MFKSVCKNIFKLLYCFVMFFACIRIVNAKSAFINEVAVGKDLYSYCSANNGCIPLCVYGDNEALIGYYYKSNDFIADSPGYIISFFSNIAAKSAQVESIRYNAVPHNFPNNNIFTGDEDINEFKTSDFYSSITNEFKCPYYFYIDEGTNPGSDICFSNSNDKKKQGCERWNYKLGIDFDDEHALKISYSFESEYYEVLTSTYNDTYLIVDSDDDNKNLDKLHFLAKYDPEINESDIDDSKGARENALKLCQYFKDSASDDKYNSYLDKLGANKGLFMNDLNSKLQYYAQNSSKRSINNIGFNDISYYNYDVLYPIMVTNNDSSNMQFRNVSLYHDGRQQTQSDIYSNSSEVKYQPIFKYLTSLYSLNVHTSVSYISSMCSEEGVTINVGDNFQQGLDNAKQHLDLHMYKDPQIDFSEADFDCSFLTDVADIISTGYFIIEMVGLAILVIFTAMDYVKIFLNDNADELKKANSNFIKRLIIAVILFLLPALVNFALRIFKIEGINSEHPLCVQISNK